MDEYENSASAGDRPTNLHLPVSSLEDFKGKVLLEAMNESGCEFLTNTLERMEPDDTQMIFSEVEGHVGMLMMHRFGSKVIQELFAVCEDEQMEQLVSSITADEPLLMAICLDSLGSQSMIKLLRCITTWKQLDCFIHGVRNIIVMLVHHPIGSGVIHQYFIAFRGAKTEPILGMIAENFLQIALSEIGSRLLQVIITDVYSGMTQRRLFAGIMLYFHDLSTHQFGNHVVQHVIGLGFPDVLLSMVYEMRGHFNWMSTHKYASNVVNKLMEATKETHAPIIIDEIISSPDFSSLLQNPYGYSVVQSAKEYSTGTLHQNLNHMLLQHSVVQSAAVPQTLNNMFRQSDDLHDQCPGKKNDMPNKKRRRNHVMLIKRRK